ncbi:MAG: hypothetical protein C4527_16525 [Candidatus Omnitrophota bacterium]|jgi:cell division protein FtsL|nr:MAG: hypothetical protein C4527_16525 [Candidatus Omnitrophota bacterium]
MIQVLNALIRDTLSWVLLFLVIGILSAGMTAIFNRYDRVDCFQNRLLLLEYDIRVLQQDIEKKKEWCLHLQNDVTAWEQVARERMNYLMPDEILVTFAPS